MSTPTNTNPDGDIMTTHGEQRTMSDGRDGHVSEVLEGGLVVLVGQSVETDVQTVLTSVGEIWDDPVVPSGDPLALDDPLAIATSPEEVMMVVDVDPALHALPTLMSEDEAVLSPSTGSPLKSVVGTPVTPHRDFLSTVDSSPGVSGRENASASGVDVEMEVGVKSRKVIGRRLAVVEDDIETQSSMSMSLDEGPTSTSSSMFRTKGVKRSRKSEDKKDKDKRTEEESNEERKRKRKGKKKEHVKKDTPEEEETGKSGEPKGVVEHDLEDLSSSVLGGAISEWANRIDEIRVKSKNLQGRLNGEMKKCVSNIKEGTALLVARSVAAGDPQFLRMRNSELDSRLREAESENARLREQLRKMSLGPSPPRRKRKVDRTASGTDATPSEFVVADTPKGKKVAPVSAREEFPPLPQRPPRDIGMYSRGNRMQHMVPASYTAICDSEGTETGAEAYFTRHINFLTSARDAERKRREYQEKEQLKPQIERRGDRLDQQGNRDRKAQVQDEARKAGPGPRIVSDIQVAPPFRERPKMSGSEVEWRVVSGGGRRGRGGRDKPPPLLLPPHSSSRMDPPVAARNSGVRATGPRVERGPGQQPRARPFRPPISSAVTITGKVEGFSYATALKSAREKINLESLGIKTSRVRKAVNGGLLIEVSGENSKEKAEELVTQLRTMLKDSAVVSCPTKKRELRVIGFDESVTAEEIIETLCRIGGCYTVDIKTGPIRTMANGLGMVWAQLPAVAAAKVAEEGRIRIGWTVARVELLKVRPLQCYRCWTFGHVQSTCRSIVNRRGACFKCGQQGHVASTCKNATHCAVCHDSGLEASHRLGGPQCAAQVRQDALVSERRQLASEQGNA